ncbi:hypothetical protein PROFUN_09740 [Planoprotostelium fungivorum]|uniref:AAA+ ATPase domain-containing protein n=1 Tax=Planoprotostelium fungivorum TaxID=1890364 RepID=A0A2P6NFA1_9EUKA|nr:hypothetical protein PROFUN_09740 [Planoprotostelium fungivorum]
MISLRNLRPNVIAHTSWNRTSLCLSSRHFASGKESTGVIQTDLSSTWGGELEKDLAQKKVAKSLDTLLDQLKNKSRRTKKGLYIYGPVGTGKTMLMKMFINRAKELAPSRLVHYDQFMEDIQNRMWQSRKDSQRSLKGPELMKKIAGDMADEHSVLCLDEIQMQDVGEFNPLDDLTSQTTASAILMRQVLEEMMNRKDFCLVSTSNLNVEDLCSKGLHAHRIGDFKNVLSKKLKVVALDSKDYRTGLSTTEKPEHRVFFSPNNTENQKQIERLFQELSQYEMVREDTLIDLSTFSMAVPRMGTMKDGRHIAWFDFDDLCNNKLGASDYIIIAKQFAAVFILNVPKLTNQKSDQAKRFISLIDQLYLRDVKVACTMEVPLDSLFQIERLGEQEFDQSLELAEDQLNLKAKTIAESNVWHADNVKAGLSLAAIFEGGKAEEFAAIRTRSRLNEMSGTMYWKDLLTKPKTTEDQINYQSDDWYTTDRLGNDLALKSALSAHRVSPRKESFRNLHHRGLLQFATDKFDSKTKTLHREPAVDSLPFHVLNAGTSNPKLEAEYKKVFPEARLKIGRANLFTRDGAVGAHHWAEVPLRVMTDSPSLDLALSHLLPSVPLRTPKEQPIQLLVYIATALKNNHLGDKDSYAVFDAKNGRLLIVGDVSASAAREAIMQAASAVYSKNTQDGLLVNADTVNVGGKNLLVFGNDLLHKQKEYGLELVSPHNTFWTSKGIVRALSGVTRLSTAQPAGYSLVEKQKEGEKVTQPVKASSTAEKPAAIVFLTEDKKGALPTVSKLNRNQSLQYFLAGYNGSEFTPFFGNTYSSINPSEVMERFKELQQQVGENVYVINIGGPKPLTPAEIGKILSSVSDGSASKAPTSEGFNLMMPISSLPGFKKITTEGKSESAKLEEELKQFISKNFPSVQL